MFEGEEQKCKRKFEALKEQEGNYEGILKKRLNLLERKQVMIHIEELVPREIRESDIKYLKGSQKSKKFSHIHGLLPTKNLFNL